MFTPPRFIVIDDNPSHLNAILDAFQDIGTPCLGVTYDPEHGLTQKHFSGVRALFIDFHLVSQLPATDETANFAVIAQILEDIISPTGGPFILVIWTQHDKSVPGLAEYLEDPNSSLPPSARPLAILSLPKDQFITLNTGVARDTDRLRAEIERAISKNPQLHALLSWETEVQSAAGVTLSALVDLVPHNTRNAASIARELDRILSRLATAAVGRPHVAGDPRAAITSALAPILADRIVNLEDGEDSRIIWRNAVTGIGTGMWDAERSGKVNRMLHLAVPPSETISSTAWGAVVEFPGGQWNDRCLKNLFGVKKKELLGGEFKIERDGRAECSPRLVRVGAACDHAQDRSGPLQYLLGIEIPCSVNRKKDKTGTVRLPSAEWRSPTLAINPGSDPFVLAVNARYSRSVTSNTAMQWKTAYRLREQLLMHLISHASGYLSRPGIIQL